MPKKSSKKPSVPTEVSAKELSVETNTPEKDIFSLGLPLVQPPSTVQDMTSVANGLYAIAHSLQEVAAAIRYLSDGELNTERQAEMIANSIGSAGFEIAQALRESAEALKPKGNRNIG